MASQKKIPKECKFVFVGRIDTALEEFFNNFQENSSLCFSGVYKKFIPDDVYRKHLDQVDYFIILYPRGEYDLTASGIFSEMVSRNKKFISLDNSYFKNIHDMCPDAGIIVNEIEEIANISMDSNCHLKKLDVEILKKYYSLEVFSKKLHSLF